MNAPTRQSILNDFRKCVARGNDNDFQFERVVRRWIACGYPLAELPALFNVSLPHVLDVAKKFEEAA